MVLQMLRMLGSFTKGALGASFRKNGGQKDSRQKKMTEDDILERRFKAVEVPEETKNMIKSLLHRRQAWFSRRPVYIAFLTAMLALCLFSILYPARVVPDITNLGPITNQAGRRRYLVWACAHLSRELVLADGFARMDKATIHGALAWHLQALRESNRALRLGHALGVRHGADWHNQEHNDIMYEHGCIWREGERPEKDCSIQGLPKLRVNGLYSLILNFYDAVEAVMAIHGVDKTAAEAAYAAYLAVGDDHSPGPEFNMVELHASRLHILEDDENLRLIIHTVDGGTPEHKGDLQHGLRACLDAFQHETAEILENVHTEARVLYACYMVLVVVLFYGMLFRKTMQAAGQEAVKARGFVHKLPTYTLAKEETDVIRRFFQHTSDSTS